MPIRTAHAQWERSAITNGPGVPRQFRTRSIAIGGLLASVHIAISTERMTPCLRIPPPIRARAGSVRTAPATFVIRETLDERRADKSRVVEGFERYCRHHSAS